MHSEHVAVIGLGASGDAAARLALNIGAKVHVTDASSEAAVAARGALLEQLGADVLLGAHNADRIAAAGTIVASPGISPRAPVFDALRDRGVGWISEPDFACRFVKSPLILVTGTNGKTTTAALCAHLLRESGIDAALGGNVGGDLGPPASALALREPRPEWIVLEMSSFQLADTREMTPAVGVMTNLGADHLDRYPSVEAYHRDKQRLFSIGSAETTWVLNGDDRAVMQMAEGVPGRRLRFSLERPLSPGAWTEGEDVVLGLASWRGRVGRVSGLRLSGQHNVANALAAALAAAAAGADPAGFGGAMESFAPLPHRLEPVASVDGVLWINDSKATNLAACAGALDGLAGPLVLMLGGTDKGEDFGTLVPLMAGRVRAVVAYGAAGPRASEELAGAAAEAGQRVRVTCVPGAFADVVEKARSLARPGDTLLLSPACSSFDMFADYRERGRVFRRAAQRLAASRGASPVPGPDAADQRGRLDEAR